MELTVATRLTRSCVWLTKPRYCLKAVLIYQIKLSPIYLWAVVCYNSTGKKTFVATSRSWHDARKLGTCG